MRWLYREIDPEEYDEAVRLRPACCPHYVLGDRRLGRQVCMCLYTFVHAYACLCVGVTDCSW